MHADTLRSFLSDKQIKFGETRIQGASQFRCATKDIFSVYDTGKVVYGGKASSLTVLVKRLEASDESSTAVDMPWPDGDTPVIAASAGNKQVFIVYGHDIALRDNLELILRRMELDPVVLANLPAAGDTIIEKLERYLGEHGNVGFGCVLLTPDDEGYKAGFDKEKKYRARQNVILEMGMVLARLGRSRVAVLHKESIELPSDIAGLIYIPFQERVDEVKAKLFAELRSAGYSPNPSGL